MSLTLRNVYTPAGHGLRRPDGTPINGIIITFYLVDSAGNNAAPFDAITQDRVSLKASTVTDVNGEFSIALWPNDRGSTATQYLCRVGNGIQDGYPDFKASLPSGGTALAWANFMASGTVLAPSVIPQIIDGGAASSVYGGATVALDGGTA